MDKKEGCASRMKAHPAAATPVSTPVAGPAVRHVFVRDLVLECSIGVHRHEHDTRQRVRINLDLAVPEGGRPLHDDIANVVSYEELVDGVRAVTRSGHVKLVETLAESIAAVCLKDRRVRSVRVRIEKLDVFPDATSVGVEIERANIV